MLIRVLEFFVLYLSSSFDTLSAAIFANFFLGRAHSQLVKTVLFKRVCNSFMTCQILFISFTMNSNRVWPGLQWLESFYSNTITLLDLSIILWIRGTRYHSSVVKTRSMTWTRNWTVGTMTWTRSRHSTPGLRRDPLLSHLDADLTR